MITDELGRQLVLPDTPMRIISLCPAITETLFALNLEHRIVGRTKYCIFPAEAANVPVVGGTKNIQLEAIAALKPDIIFCEKEENTPEIVAELEQQYNVYVAEIQQITEAYRMIEKLGFVTNKLPEAIALIHQIQQRWTKIPQKTGRAAYMMWRKPYMVVGETTYINSVLHALGFTNPFITTKQRYPAVTIEDLQQAQLDYLFLSSEPFPFSDKHIAELQSHLPDTQIQLIDGEMFWYGAKMLESTTYFQHYFK